MSWFSSTNVLWRGELKLFLNATKSPRFKYLEVTCSRYYFKTDFWAQQKKIIDWFVNEQQSPPEIKESQQAVC